MALSKRLPLDVLERVQDYLVGEREFWKLQYNQVVRHMKMYQPEEIEKNYFFEDRYRRLKDVIVQAYDMMEDLWHPAPPPVMWSIFMPRIREHVQNHPLTELIQIGLDGWNDDNPDVQFNRLLRSVD